MAAPCWLFRNARYGFGRIKSTPPQFRITASVLRASTSPSKDSPNSIVKPLAKTGQYVFSKFKFFLEGYDKILRKFPVAYRLHQVFVVGTKDLYQDVRTYMKISQDLRSGKSVRELSRSELELYYRVPRDMLKMVPILTIISLPGTNFIMFPLIYLFPGHLLTWQFWSLEQRIDFAVAQQRKKKLAEENGLYRVRVANEQNDPAFVVSSFAKACSLYESELKDHFMVTLDRSGALLGVSDFVGQQCTGTYVPDHKLVNFNTTLSVSIVNIAPGCKRLFLMEVAVPNPALHGIIAGRTHKLIFDAWSRKKAERARGENADNRSFFAKYWMYIMPLLIFLLISGASNPEGQGGGSSGR
ncbi:hypothetical protein HPB49_009609 [Dermacentor silvarum]|uniref:Uncharacterized protein n=1 Tax=Dermacentor silvarum TaxID=543639 RepID=A0ACB8CWN4_DERSI|nr:hypothetical protein HPB49_009609 [Dermacentor silvarum]